MKKTVRLFLILLALLALTTANAIAQTGVSREEAENLALQAAGISREEATLLSTQTEKEDGREIYDIEFNANGLEYEFHLSVSDGTILKSKWEADDASMLEKAKLQSADSVWIGEEQALANALADASLAQADVTVSESKFDTEDLLKVYEITFTTADAEYEYEIDALSGEICAKSVQYRTNEQNGEQTAEKKSEEKTEKKSEEKQTSSETKAEESSSLIGVDRAKSIALEHAGLSESDVKFSKAKLEKDDGKRIYEIEFHVGNMEYEYEIDAKSGKILDYDKEYDDD